MKVRRMRKGAETVVATDRFGTKVLLHRNMSYGYDLQTDGRVYLDVDLARELATVLTAFADELDPKGGAE